MVLFDDLRDNEWALVEALFCSEPARSERRGRPRVEARSVVNAVLWVLSTGEGWSKLPGRYPSPLLAAAVSTNGRRTARLPKS